MYEILSIEQAENKVNQTKITRSIKKIQLHHTYSPSYKNFNGNNHITLQTNMKSYHVKTNGWADIGQHFTIFPDGKIVFGRSLNSSPAGIKGGNTGAICIECLGNFDKGGDSMKDAQKNAIVAFVRFLLSKFNLSAKDSVVYHAWYSTGGTYLGDYVAGKSAKTCPGTNFFGGNTRKAYQSNLLPLLTASEAPKSAETEFLTSGNDITWELNYRYFPIQNMRKFSEELEKARLENSSLYWGYYKLVNRIK